MLFKIFKFYNGIRMLCLSQHYYVSQQNPEKLQLLASCASFFSNRAVYQVRFHKGMSLLKVLHRYFIRAPVRINATA